MNEVRFYGYKHWTLEEVPRCFYVGKGLESRPQSSRQRNHKWYAIVKRLGIRVEVCLGPVTNEEACDWEILNIELEKTFTTNHDHNDDNDIGCNLDRGGRGVVGYVWTKQQRKNVSERITGEGNPMFGKRGVDSPNFGKRRIGHGREVICGCGKILWVKNSSGQKFCSKQCYIKYHPNKDPKVRAKLSKIRLQPEFNAKVLLKQKQTMSSKEWKEKHTGENASNSCAIEQWTKDNVFVARYVSIREASIRTNTCYSSIHSVLRGKTKTANGFVWKRSI